MTIIDKIGKYKQPNRFWFTRNVNTITKISVHHDAIPHSDKTAEQVMQQIMNGHVAQGWVGASYHYYIHKDGKVYQLNKLEEVTWIDGINWDALGIVMNGYFHPSYNNSPTKEQLISLKALLDELTTQHPEFPAGKADVLAHRDRAQTACNGDKAYPYVKEYREKLGNVSWGASAPTPPPGESFLGKPKEYWLQVEADRLSLLAEVGQLKTQLNNVKLELKNKILGYIEELKNKVSSS